MRHVFAPSARFEGWDPVAYRRLTSLFRDDGVPSRDGVGGVLVVTEGDTILSVTHSVHGPIAQAAYTPEAGALGGWVQHTSSRWGLSVTPSSLAALEAELSSRLGPKASALDSWLNLARVAHEQCRAGTVGLWPSPAPATDPSTASPTAADMFQRTVGFVVTEGHCFALALFDDNGVHSACALRRSASGFDLVAGPHAIVAQVGLLSGDWRRDYRLVNESVSSLYGPVALGCYAETRTIDKLASSTGARAWATALAMRELVVSPAPAAFTLGLGVGAVRTALRDMAELARRASGSDIASDAIAGATTDARDFLRSAPR